MVDTPISPSQDAGPARWRAADGAVLRWFHWQDESVLFHEPSGKTHLLNPASVALLAVILRTPRTVDEALQELASGAEAPDTDELLQLRETLLQFEDYGLVERC